MRFLKYLPACLEGMLPEAGIPHPAYTRTDGQLERDSQGQFAKSGGGSWRWAVVLLVGHTPSKNPRPISGNSSIHRLSSW
jgi:hypothetical protein